MNDSTFLDPESGTVARPDPLPPHILARASLIYLSKEETLRVGFTLAFIYYGATGLISLLAPAFHPVIFYLICICIGVACFFFFYGLTNLSGRALRRFAPLEWQRQVHKWHDHLLTVAYTVPVATAVDLESPRPPPMQMYNPQPEGVAAGPDPASSNTNAQLKSIFVQPVGISKANMNQHFMNTATATANATLYKYRGGEQQPPRVRAQKA